MKYKLFKKKYNEDSFDKANGHGWFDREKKLLENKINSKKKIPLALTYIRTLLKHTRSRKQKLVHSANKFGIL